MPTFDIGNLLSGFFNLIGSGVNASVQKDIAQQSIQAQYDIAAQNNASQERINEANINLQRELNESQIAESEKAYQRSTIDAQVKQFIDAGYSEQQALRAVMGAAAGQYAPASLGAATLEAPMIDPSGFAAAYAQKGDAASNIGSAVSSIGQTLGTFGTMLSDSLKSADGGAIGAMQANKAVTYLTEHLAELDPSKRSYYGLKEYLNSDSASDEWKEFANSSAWKDIQSSPFARKYLNEFFKQSYSFSESDIALERSRYAAALAQRDVTLRQLTWDDEVASTRAQYVISQLDAKYRSEVNELSIRGAIARFNAQIADDELLYNLKTNASYRQNWLKSQMLDQSNALIIGQVLEKKYSGQLSWLNQQDNADFYAIMELLDAAGMTSSDVGAVMSVIMASGVDVPSAARDIAERINKFVSDPNGRKQIKNSIDSFYSDPSSVPTNF